MVKNQGHLESQEALSFHTMCCTINIIYNFSTQRKFLVPDNPFGKDVKIEMIVTSVKKGPISFIQTVTMHLTYFYPFQTMSISMYFGVSWLDPRLNINHSATEWYEVKTGPKDVSHILCFISFLKTIPCFKSSHSYPKNDFSTPFLCN